VRGAPVDARTELGDTALHSAAYPSGPVRQTTVLTLLLGRGADVNARDAEGHTPLDYAIHAGDTAVIEVLTAAGGVAGTPIPPAD
jgi:ankyrin repeat protein